MAQAALGGEPAPAASLRATVSVGGYTSFSPRLAASLLGAGGVFAIVGGLGLWVRAVALTTSGIHQIATVSGVSHASGWLIAALGIGASAGSLVRSQRIRWLAAAASIAAVVLIAMRISGLSDQASRMAFRAGAEAGRAFTAYHAGFGWGAWVMTLAAVLLSLGTIVTLLRWVDERQGYVG